MTNNEMPRELKEEANFRAAVKKMRLEKRWSQSELAKKMADEGWGDYNQTTISRIENGGRPITIAESRTLARIFNSSLEKMFSSTPLLENYFHLREATRKFDAMLKQFRNNVAMLDTQRKVIDMYLAFIESQGVDDIRKIVPQDEVLKFDTTIKQAYEFLNTSVSDQLKKYYETMSEISEFLHGNERENPDGERAQTSKNDLPNPPHHTPDTPDK